MPCHGSCWDIGTGITPGQIAGVANVTPDTSRADEIIKESTRNEKMLKLPIPEITDPRLRFFDWEDRPMAILDIELYRVLNDKKLVPASNAISFADILCNSTEISMEEAIAMANSN